MYTLFIQKKHHDPSPFPLTEQLHQFILDTDANGIFVCPAHLSRDTLLIQQFLDSFLDGTNIRKFGIGNKYVSRSITDYETYLDGRHILWHINRNGKSDHRKMMFILNISNPDDLPTLDIHNYRQVAESYIEVLGIAIGSSNFSHPTYGLLTPGAMSADKGEADVFLFYNEDYKNRILQQNNDAMVLSASITRVPDDFLMKMFLETLNYTLA